MTKTNDVSILWRCDLCGYDENAQEKSSCELCGLMPSEDMPISEYLNQLGLGDRNLN